MRQIENYPNYLVSVDGKIFNLKTMKYLKPLMRTTGYYAVRLYNELGNKFYSIHRVVANTYLKKDENKKFVNHIDGNKTNNLLCNLEWCTHSENMKHAWDLGLNKSTKKHKENGRNTIKIAQEIGSKMKRKAIVDVSNGRTFDYVVDAAKYLGVRKQTLTNWLNGHRPNKTTLKYI